MGLWGAPLDLHIVPEALTIAYLKMFALLCSADPDKGKQGPLFAIPPVAVTLKLNRLRSKVEGSWGSSNSPGGSYPLTSYWDPKDSGIISCCRRAASEGWWGFSRGAEAARRRTSSLGWISPARTSYASLVLSPASHFNARHPF